MSEIPPWVKGKIIDVHCHIGIDQRFLLSASEEEVLDAMNRYGIAKAFISAISSLLYDFKAGNRHVGRVVSRHPDRFVGLAIINPLYGEEALEEFRFCIEKLGLRGLKLHPEYSGVEASHPIVEPLLEEARRLRVPVMIHSYDGGVDACAVAEKFEDLVIVMYHMGGLMWREGVERACRHHNVYLEISSSVVDAGMIEYAVEKVGADRVLFGSDMPYQDPAVSLGKVLGAEISEEEMELILFKNAQRVLGV